jgi:hypothetical protein
VFSGDVSLEVGFQVEFVNDGKVLGQDRRVVTNRLKKGAGLIGGKGTKVRTKTGGRVR